MTGRRLFWLGYLVALGVGVTAGVSLVRAAFGVESMFVAAAIAAAVLATAIIATLLYVVLAIAVGYLAGPAIVGSINQAHPDPDLVIAQQYAHLVEKTRQGTIEAHELVAWLVADEPVTPTDPEP